MKEIEEAQRKSATRTLHVLLVISFVVSGYHLLAYLVMGVTPTSMKEQMMTMSGNFPEEFAIMMDKFLAIPQWYFLVSALLNAASVAGLAMMWRLRGNGFHCYTLSKLMLMLMPVLFLDRSYIAAGDIMMAILFIVYYFVLMRMLGAFDKRNDTTDSVSVENTDGHTQHDDQESEK